MVLLKTLVPIIRLNDRTRWKTESLCLDESTVTNGSVRLAVLSYYCVGNYIKKDLINITWLAATTKYSKITKLMLLL